jgi:hypothetical protein
MPAPDISLSPRFSVAVIMERIALHNRWASERWEAKGVVRDEAPAGTASRVIVDTGDTRQVLFPGYEIKLQRHESEGYYLNLTSPQPKVFVLWRMKEDGAPRPEMLTVSYNEGTRWADSGEQVDGVALPIELAACIAEFVETYYEPEPPKRKRYATNRDKGRMGRTGP